jgi:hypothetical protein
MLTVTDIFRRHADRYLSRFGPRLPPSHRRAIADIVGCGTAAMGGRLVACDECGRFRPVYHSCRNRACPACHGKETVRWLAGRAGELLPVTYHHVVFTVPCQLRRLLRGHQRTLLDALMRAAAQSLQALCADPRYGGGRIAILAVLHTWSSTLLWHPHVHCLVPGLVVRPDGTWVRINRKFLAPVLAVSPVFRAKFAALARAALPGVRLPDAIWRVDWNVRSRPCLEGPGNVLRYLARYVFRGPMSARRILGIENGRYLIAYRDNQTRRVTKVRLEPDEFLRRYLQHTLPRGFHRVRYFGWWGPSCRATLRGMQMQLGPGLADLARSFADELDRGQQQSPARLCPYCGCTHSHTIVHWSAGAVPPAACRGPPL